MLCSRCKKEPAELGREDSDESLCLNCAMKAVQIEELEHVALFLEDTRDVADWIAPGFRYAAKIVRCRIQHLKTGKSDRTADDLERWQQEVRP